MPRQIIDAEIRFKTGGELAAGGAGGDETKRTSQSLEKISRVLLGGEFSAFLTSMIKLPDSFTALGIAAGVGLGAKTGIGIVEGGVEGVEEAFKTQDVGKVKDIDEAIEDGTVSINEYNDSVTETKSSLNEMEEAFNDLGDDVTKTGNPLKEFLKDITRISASIVRAIQSIDRQSNAAKVSGNVSTDPNSGLQISSNRTGFFDPLPMSELPRSSNLTAGISSASSTILSRFSK